MNRTRTIVAFVAAALSLLACQEKNDLSEPVVYLDVNANNISGTWELESWNGSPLQDGTYVYLDIVRKDRTYTMYQNLDSFSDVPHVLTGTYALSTDPELGAIIRGSYDHDSGEWAHRYIIRSLTATEMVWVAKDDPDFVQIFARIGSIPVE